MASDVPKQLNDLDIPLPALIAHKVKLPSLEKVVKLAHIPLYKDVLQFRFQKQDYWFRLIRDHGKISFLHKDTELCSNTPAGIIKKIIGHVYPNTLHQRRSWQRIFFLGSSLNAYRCRIFIDTIMKNLNTLSEDILNVQFFGDWRQPGKGPYALVVENPEQFTLKHPHLVDDPYIQLKKYIKLVPQASI